MSCKEPTYKIIYACYKVHNALGARLSEIVYHKALAKEFTSRAISFQEQNTSDVEECKKELNSFYLANFIIEEKVIVMARSCLELPAPYVAWLYNRFNDDKYKLAFIVNFGQDKLKISHRFYKLPAAVSSIRGG